MYHSIINHMPIVDPNDFIITRKRKKYKFAKFSNAENCFEINEWQQKSQGQALRSDGSAHAAQGTTKERVLGDVDVVEVGAGTGLFSVELATSHPDQVFAAIDVKGDRLQKGAYEALERGIHNIYFIRARADQIEDLFEAHSLTEIWLTFSDPFPRKHSAGRRLTHPTFLKKYAKLLCSGPGPEQVGRLLIKHDNSDFFNWSLEQLVAEKWHIAELSFDLRESDLSGEYKIKTTYEERWMNEGRITKFVSVTAPFIAENRT